MPPVDAIVVTHPHNPTGLITPEGHLRSLAAHAVRHGQTVIIDASFRGQVRAAQYDMYALLDEAGADWIIIEDTGKLWPTHELKIGMLAYSTRTKLPIERAFSESLLSASPVVLQLIGTLARDWSSGGYERARAHRPRNGRGGDQAGRPAARRSRFADQRRPGRAAPGRPALVPAVQGPRRARRAHAAVRTVPASSLRSSAAGPAVASRCCCSSSACLSWPRSPVRT